MADRVKEVAKALDLSPQETYLYAHHYSNLTGSGKVMQANGDISTVRQLSFEQDGKVYNVPTIWAGKELSPDDAIQKAIKTGLNKFPSYATEQEAEDRYQQMHKYMDADVENFRRSPAYSDLLSPEHGAAYDLTGAH